MEPLVNRNAAANFGRFVCGIVLALLLFWAVGNDVVLGRVLQALDDTYAALDSLIPAEKAPPSAAAKTGSAASKLTNSLGPMT